MERIADATVHGFHSSFRDWVGDTTKFSREVAEAALAHAIGSEVERAYRRGDALAERRKMMAAWAEYLDALREDTGTVLTFKRKASGEAR